MTPDDILSIKPKVLTQKQREFYFENGYILLEKFLPDQWIERLRTTTDEMVDRQAPGCPDQKRVLPELAAQSARPRKSLPNFG